MKETVDKVQTGLQFGVDIFVLLSLIIGTSVLVANLFNFVQLSELQYTKYFLGNLMAIAILRLGTLLNRNHESKGKGDAK